MTSYKATSELLAFLKRWEGVRYKVYRDVAGYPTVGVGHLVLASDGLKVGDTITEEQVDAFLKKDLGSALSALTLVKVPLTQKQITALASFIYNVGIGAFKRSTLLRLLNKGLYAKAADQFLRWNTAKGVVIKGLTNRRQAERALFLDAS